MGGTQASTVTHIGHLLDRRRLILNVSHQSLAIKLADRYGEVYGEKARKPSYVVKLVIAWRTGRKMVPTDWYLPIALAISDRREVFSAEDVRKECIKSRAAASGVRRPQTNDEGATIEAFNYYRANRDGLRPIGRAYYEACAHPDFPVVTKTEWLPAHPISMHDVDQLLRREWVEHVSDPVAPMLNAFGPETYAQFMASIAPNVRQDDNFCYRLIEATPLENNFKLVFCPSRYSNFVNSCDVLGYELAAWVMQHQTANESAIPRADGTDLIARGAPEAIFDLRNRSACPATSAVLILRNTSKGDFFYLHERTSPQLLDSPGGFHVVPSGQFQPDTAEDTHHDRNFSITRTVMRELAEELLGVKEVEEAIRTYDDFYDDPRVAPFVSGLESGAVQLYFLGMGFDPLPTKPGFYIALVIDATRIPAPSLKFLNNWEGKFLAAPMNELERWSQDSRMIPDGAMCLRLALKHLDKLVPETKGMLSSASRSIS